MHHSRAIRTGLAGSALSLAAALALIVFAGAPAAGNGFGSDNAMFKRHFWRGQAYHGAGYQPRVSDNRRDRVEGEWSRASDKGIIE